VGVLLLVYTQLNRTVREQTDKTTSVHLAERVLAEAKALLHTS